MPSPIIPTHKDDAQGSLLSGINASTLTITLQTGEGAEFPQPYTGTCSSTGSSTTLNDTGDLAGVTQYQYIRNVTDGSWAVCLTTGTNSITTTRLQGGTLNVWTSGDEWRVGEFVITLTKVDGEGEITQSEKCLVKNRSSDTLTVATGGRGYDGSSAQTFDADDLVNIFVEKSTPEEMKKWLAEHSRLLNTNITDIATNVSDINNIESNATFYVAAAGSSNAFTGTLAAMPAAYTTGERLYFKANHDITGTANFNRASLGAKTIKKVTTAGKIDLVSGDIQDTGIYEIVYDGTDYLLQTPVANVPVADADTLYTTTADSSNNDNGSWTAFNQSYAVTASSVAVGDVLETTIVQTNDGGTRDLRLKLGSTVVWTITNIGVSPSIIKTYLTVTNAGASGTGRYVMEHIKNASSVVEVGTFSSVDWTSAVTISVEAEQTAGSETSHLLKSFRVIKYATP